jgi:hypothetical protein
VVVVIIGGEGVKCGGVVIVSDVVIVVAGGVVGWSWLVMWSLLLRVG